MMALMARLLEIWRSWSVQRRAITVGVLALAAAGLGVLAYELLKRPADVTNEDVGFVEEGNAKPEKPEKPKDKTVDWPTYGLNNERTRFFASNVVEPPFAGSD